VDKFGGTGPSSTCIAQVAYLKASNTDADDRFGYSVGVSGNTVVVGARREDSSATGVNGDQSDNSAPDAGAAYVFVRNGASRSQQAYLKASNTDAGDEFGYRVAIADDTIVVGARKERSIATGVNGDQTNNGAIEAGAAYVFVRNGSTWSQQAYLKASNTDPRDWFGQAVAISGDTLVIGAERESSSATGVDGDQNNNSVGLSGAAYVFVRTGTNWSQQAYIKASNTGEEDRFGQAVAISGDTIVVGAPLEKSDAWDVNGDESNDNLVYSGAAYVFARSGSTWSQQAYLKGANTDEVDYFGCSVAVSGDTVVVGADGEDSSATGVDGDGSDNSAPFAGAAYTFWRSGSGWHYESYLKASNTWYPDNFGCAVVASSDTVVVGAKSEGGGSTGVNGDQYDYSAGVSGAAYLFVRDGWSWKQEAYLKASNTGARDNFGYSLAISGSSLVIGARTEDSGASGVNGNPRHRGSLGRVR